MRPPFHGFAIRDNSIFHIRIPTHLWVAAIVSSVSLHRDLCIYGIVSHSRGHNQKASSFKDVIRIMGWHFWFATNIVHHNRFPRFIAYVACIIAASSRYLTSSPGGGAAFFGYMHQTFDFHDLLER
jgi:hypothetical protein